VTVAIFHKAAAALGDHAPDPEAKIDPYAASMDPDRWEADGLYSDSGWTLEAARERAQGVEGILVDAVAQPVEASAA
jgi:hypothetical protein